MTRGLALLLLACLFCLISPSQGKAADNEDLAVVFVLDNSGSMKLNDPGKIRFSAASMLVDLLRSKDKVGLVSFSGKAQVLVPMSGLDSRDQRNSVKTILAGAENGKDWTDLSAGLEAAFSELEKAQGQGIVILVSDGEPEPGPGFRSNQALQETYLKSLWTSVSRYSSKGYPIYSIGLSTQVDISLLQKLSRETGGSMFRAPNAEALPGIFQDILGGFRDNISLGEFTSPLSLEQWGEPNLIRVNSSLKLLTFRGLSTDGHGMELQLKDPGGKLLSEGAKGITMVRGPNYSSISIENPVAGNWLVQAKGRGTGRIKAEGQSQYSLQVMQPTTRANLPVKSPVRFAVKVTENGLPVTNPELKLTLKSQGQGVLELKFNPNAPGLYNGELDNFLELPGPKNFRLSLEDKSGEIIGRELFYYGKDVPYLALTQPKQGWTGENYPFEATVMYKGQRHTEGTFKVQVRTTGADKVWDSTLEDTGRNGDTKAGDGIYSGWFSPAQVGNYKCNFMITGTVRGQSFSYETGDLPLVVGVRPEILIDETREMSVGQAGILQVQLESKAKITEDVTLGGKVGDWKIPAQTLYLHPGEKRIVNLVVPWDTVGKSTAGKLYLSGPNLRGQEQEISVYFRGTWQDIWYSHKLSITICLSVGLILCGLLGIGAVLFRYYKQALRLSGMLVIGQSGRSAVPRRLVPLQSFNKSKLTLGLGEGNDITLDLGERGVGSCALVLEAKFPESVPNFLIGWLCLIGKHKPVTVLTSTGGTLWLKEKTAKRPMVRSKTVLSDGDEVSFYGCKMLFRR
jgi:hypothetical protein